MPLRDDLLDPIPGNNPSGADLYYAPLFDEIKEARRQEDAGPMGLWEHARKTADYKQVIRLAQEALATKTKDLRLAAWLTEALIWRDQFAGLRDGLELIRGLIEKFWDTLYPELEDNDAEFRAAPVEWLGNYFEPEKGSSPALAVRNVPLTSSGLNWYQYKESRAVGYERDSEGNEARSKARQEALAEGKLAPEQFDAALGETPKAFYRTLEADRAGSVESLQALNELCQVTFGDASPSMGKLRQALEEVGSTVHVLLQKKLEQDPDPAPVVEVEQEQAAAVSEDQAAGVPPLDVSPGQLETFVGVEVASREDAIGHLLAVARYLRRADPSSPIPYLVLRALRWGELRASDDNLAPRLLEAPPSEIRIALKRHALAGDWKQVLETAERAMSSSCGRGWLDLQRYAIQACEELGHHSAAKAIRSELKALLTDFPQLLNMTLTDDTGTANPETLAWLYQEGFVSSA